jgi:hypothetical protein
MHIERYPPLSLQSESYKLAKPNRIQTQDQGKTNKDKERNKPRREEKKEDFGKARSHSTTFSGQGRTLQQIKQKKRNKPNNKEQTHEVRDQQENEQEEQHHGRPKKTSVPTTEEGT